MGNINAQLWREKTNPLKTAIDQIGLEIRNERLEWVKLRKYKIMNMMYQKIAGMRWMWKSSNGVTKTELDTLTNRSDIVTDVAVTNQVNIGSDHKMAMKNKMTKRPPKLDTTQMGSKKIEFQLELDDIDTMSDTSET